VTKLITQGAFKVLKKIYLPNTHGAFLDRL
jgi:hypothetical protein